MKFLRSHQDHFLFHLERREKSLLVGLLKRYPLVPGGHLRLSRSATPDAAAENQRLLEESLAAHRRENQRLVLAMLEESECFQADASGYRFKLSSAQIEGLLQVLNDIRVGSWIALGSPDTENGERLALNARTAPHLWSMEMAGFFQAGLLAATGGA